MMACSRVEGCSNHVVCFSDVELLCCLLQEVCFNDMKWRAIAMGIDVVAYSLTRRAFALSASDLWWFGYDGGANGDVLRI